MQLINVNGLALLGPGSEWFWTMAQFLALLGTGLAIFRQLRVQRGANELVAVTRLADELMSEQMMRHQLAALIHVADKRPGTSPSLGFIADWFDATADVIRHGYVDPGLAWRSWGDVAQFWWGIVAPMLPEVRKTDPRRWVAWERWVIEGVEKDRKAGSVSDFSAEVITQKVPEDIAYWIARLRIEQETKTGFIPTWPVAEAASRRSPTAEDRGRDHPGGVDPRGHKAS